MEEVRGKGKGIYFIGTRSITFNMKSLPIFTVYTWYTTLIYTFAILVIALFRI